MITKMLSLDWWRKDADKPVALLMGLVHLVALASFFPPFFSISGVVVCFVFYLISGWLGITLCYHRLLTHASFKTFTTLRYILTVFACLAWQRGPISWVGTHRCHHKNSDKDDDPHTPKHGFTWAHILWTVTKTPDVVPENYAKDLMKEPMMVVLDRLWWVPQTVLAFLLYFAGWYIGGHALALSWIFWGIGVRTVFVYHTTWFVNSATHTWGYKNFRHTGEDSRNLWWVALLSFGEGWHNNHHAHPRSASHGMRSSEIDITYMTIVAMSWLGLAWDIHRPPKLETMS